MTSEAGQAPSPYGFAGLQRADLPRLRQWLGSPEAARWWGDPDEQYGLIEEDLAVREFVPVIQRIHKVSSYSTPSTWDLETDRGPVQLVLKAEEDIRRLSGRTHLMITSQDGVQFSVPDSTALDRTSRKLLERFL